jgi:hypothetical protein
MFKTKPCIANCIKLKREIGMQRGRVCSVEDNYFSLRPLPLCVGFLTQSLSTA